MAGAFQRSDQSIARLAGCHVFTARRCLHAVRLRRWYPPRSVQKKTSSLWMISKRERSSVDSCCTTTFRSTRSEKSADSDRPAEERLGMVRLHEERWKQFCPTTKAFPTLFELFQT